MAATLTTTPERGVPVRGPVLEWARTSLFMDLPEAARLLGIKPVELERMEAGELGPTASLFKQLMKTYRQTESMLLLPSPPARARQVPDFRAVGTAAPLLSADLREAIRNAQEIQSYLSDLLDIEPDLLPKARLGPAAVDDDPAQYAPRARHDLGISLSAQKAFSNDSSALSAWRGRLQHIGIISMQVKLQWGVLRGFSLANDQQVPLVCISTEDTMRGRIFTLFHEVGHLLLKSGGICNVGPGTDSHPSEHWCSRFAAELLMPADAFAADVRDVRGHRRELTRHHVDTLARRYSVSAYATAIRISELKLATLRPDDRYALYNLDRARSSGGGGGSRSEETRVREWGYAAVEVVLGAAAQGVITLTEACNVLKVPAERIGELRALSNGERSKFGFK